jgi:hypothetical protein
MFAFSQKPATGSYLEANESYTVPSYLRKFYFNIMLQSVPRSS